MERVKGRGTRVEGEGRVKKFKKKKQEYMRKYGKEEPGRKENENKLGKGEEKDKKRKKGGGMN